MARISGDLLTPPKYSFDEKTRLARFIHVLCLELAVVLLIPVIHNTLSGNWDSVIILIGEEIVVFITFWLNRRGILNWAMSLLAVTFLATATLLLITSDQGIRDVSIMIFPAIIVIGGLFLSLRMFLFLTCGTILCLSGVVVAQINGFLFSTGIARASWTDIIDLTIILGITASASRFLGNHLREVARWATSHEAALAKMMGAYDQCDFGMCVVNADTRNLELMNAAFTALYGRSVDQMRGMPITGLFAQRHQSDLQKLIQDAIESGHAEIESEQLRADGTEFSAFVEMTAVKDRPGHAAYLVVHSRDITPKKKKLEKLEEDAEIYRNIMMNAYDGISIFEENPDPYLRRLVDCNERYAQMSGRTREELLKIGYQYPLTIPLTHELNHADIEKLGYGSAFRGTMSWIRPDGKDNIIEYTGILANFRGKTYTIGIDHDITKQIRTEEALRESEKRYKYLASGTFEGIVITIGGKIIEANEQMARLLGYDSPSDLIDTSMLTHVAPESLKLVRDQIESDGTRPIDHIMKRKDGSKFYVETLSKMIRYRGEPARLTAVRDASERMQIETERKDSEERFRLIFDNVNDPITILDTEGHFLEVNAAACDMLGYSRDELIGKTPQRIELPRYAAKVPEWLAIIREKGSLVYESGFQDRGGRIIQAEINSRLIVFTGIPAILSVVRDITKRSRTGKRD